MTLEAAYLAVGEAWLLPIQAISSIGRPSAGARMAGALIYLSTAVSSFFALALTACLSLGGLSLTELASKKKINVLSSTVFQPKATRLLSASQA